MPFSTTIASVFVLLLSQVLPIIGVDIGSEQLESAVQTFIAILVGLWVWYARVRKGDVTVLGARK